SLGVFHAKWPQKCLAWGVCAPPGRLRSSLVVTDLAPVKGAFPQNGTIELRVYSAANHDMLSVKLSAHDLEALKSGVDFETLIPGLACHLSGELGYYTLYSEYGGLLCYTLLQSPRGGIS